MIIDVLFLIIKGVVEVLLLPLSALNIGINFVASFPTITRFISVVAYILPWNNIMPLIILTISIFIFRIVISLIKTIWELIPIL